MQLRFSPGATPRGFLEPLQILQHLPGREAEGANMSSASQRQMPGYQQTDGDRRELAKAEAKRARRGARNLKHLPQVGKERT